MIISGTLAAILAAIAATAAISEGATQATKSSRQQSKLDEAVNKFKTDYPDVASEMTDAQIEALVGQYQDTKGWSLFSDWGHDYGVDYDELQEDLNDFNKIRSELGDMPAPIDYGAIQKEASNAIDAENQQVLNIYNENEQRSINNLKSLLQQNNQMYNDQVNNILSTNYQNNASLLNTMGSALDKTRQNALEAGASAGVRLAGNINTLLSVQNQQNQQSLETSNNLAQMLLNQRQAAMGIRNDYNNVLNNYANQRASLMSGTAERKANYANSMMNQQQNIYDQRLQNWNDNLTAVGDGNPFVDYYKNQQYKNQYKNSQGY